MPNTTAVRDLQHLGRLIRAARKFQRLRQDEVGAFSHSSIGQVELGKPSPTENLVRCIDLCTNRARTRQDFLAWTLFNERAHGQCRCPPEESLVPDQLERNRARPVLRSGFHRKLSRRCKQYPALAESRPQHADRRGKNIRRGQPRTLPNLRDQLGVTRTASARLLDQLTENIGPAADRLLAEFEDSDIAQDIVRAGQIRALRKVRFIAIRDMVDRLKRPDNPSTPASAAA